MQSPALSAACPACPVETTLTLISDKWKVLILRDLMPGTKRFGELKKSIGTVTQKVLTAQLRQMEARHLFTHIRWDMTGYLVQVEGRGPEDWLWADGAIRARLAVPSAFEKFTRALPAEGE